MTYEKKRALKDAICVAMGFIFCAVLIVIFLQSEKKEQLTAEADTQFMMAIARLSETNAVIHQRMLIIQDSLESAEPRDTIFRKAKTLRDTIIIAAVLYSSEYLPPSKVLALCFTESSFNPRARGNIGEIGLMQILPSSARQVGFNFPESLFCPVYNIRAGTALMTYYCDYYGGRLPGMSAYTTGKQGGSFAYKYDALLRERARRWVWL